MIGHHVLHHLPSVKITISVKQTRTVYEKFSKSKWAPKKISPLRLVFLYLLYIMHSLISEVLYKDIIETLERDGGHAVLLNSVPE